VGVNQGPDRSVTTGIRRAFYGANVRALGIIQSITHYDGHSDLVVISLDHHRRIFRQFSRPGHREAVRLIESMFEDVDAPFTRAAAVPRTRRSRSQSFPIPPGTAACPDCATTGMSNHGICSRCDGRGLISLASLES
jgi:hypothetical protein